MLTRTLATLALSLFALSSPVPAGPEEYNSKYSFTNLKTNSPTNELLVFNPSITSPKAGDQWEMGQTYNAAWVTDNFPPELQNATGFILLGHAGNNSENLDQHPLAAKFPLAAGSVPITMPTAVDPLKKYFIVLFGDSGNASPYFSIVPPANDTTDDTDGTLSSS